MADSSNSTAMTMTTADLSALSDRLTDHADSITNAAAHNMEVDIRLAAAALRRVEGARPAALLSALQSEIERIATACTDKAAARQLRQLIG